MTDIIINPYATTTQLVGHIPIAVPNYYGISCHSYEVIMPPGVLKHLKKQNHWNEFLIYYKDIPYIISNPDYAGQNPKEPNSVELYKFLGDHILIAIKLNPKSRLFLGTFYELDNGHKKIQGRLKNKRIYPFSFFK